MKSEADRGFLILARTCEWIGIILTFTTPFLVLGLVRDEFEAPGAGWLVAVAALVGYVLSDWLSGMVHWAGDRWGTENTFMLGPTIVKPFRLHHSDQKDITRHGFVQTNANNCMGTTVILVFSLLLPDTDAPSARVLVQRIQTAMLAPVEFATGRTVDVTLSIGLAAAQPTRADADYKALA